MARVNVREFSFKKEAAPGTAETLAIADVTVRSREGDVWQQLVELFETGEVHASSSMRPQLPGVESVDATISYILRGPGDQVTVPAVSDLWESSMFIRSAGTTIDIGAIAGGPYKAGEVVTGDGSGATGLVLVKTATGASQLPILVLSGTFTASDVLTGSITAATATSAAATITPNIGFLFRPADSTHLSGPFHHVTAGFNQDGLQLIGRGMLSNLQLQFDVGRPVVGTQRFVGGKDQHKDQALLQPSSYPEEEFAAPRFECSDLIIDAYSPTDIRSMTLTVETNPELRQDAQDCSGGVLYADYQKNAPTLVVDPAQVPVSEFDFWGKAQSGVTFPVTWTVGVPSGGGSAGLRWQFIAPEAQITTTEMGEERNLATFPLNFQFSGTTNDELFIYNY